MKYQDYVKPRWYFILLTIIFLLSIDQATKKIASVIIKQERSFVFGFFGFKYITHQFFYIPGIIKINDPRMVIHIFLKIVIIIFIYLAYRFLILYSTSRKLLYWAFIFSFSGLLSNFVDNIFLGYSRDFLVFWKLGITNFADMVYYVGLSLFLICIFNNSEIRMKLNRISLENIKTFFQFSKNELKRLITTPFKVFVKIKALLRNM